MTEQIVSEGGVVIYNPTAGRGQGVVMALKAKELLGPKYEWRPTQKAGHAIQLAREAGATHEVVVAMGGDGTVGDVARGLLGTNAALGVLPAGTGNDFARNLNLKLELDEAVSTVLSGVVRHIDVGMINDTPFINNAGTGFDAAVMKTMNTSIRFARGYSAFLLAILKTLPTYKPFRLNLTTVDGEKIEERAYMVSVLNGRMYGGGMLAAPFAEMDDGNLDLMIIKAVPKIQLLPLIGKVRSGQHMNHKAVRVLKARGFSVKTVPTQPLNIDGDVTGLTPADITTLPRALKVLVR
ncbi:MAG: diacylglycerol kinase family lipid kinase [Capsulimonadales bacterium]|nr:diacylglycerol kinase family lipid kinase [Capsulimonadales bacterium]